MNKLTINYQPEEITKIIKAVNDYNASHNRQDMNILLNKLFSNSDSLEIACDGEPTSDNRTDYLLTVVPVWCHDLDTLETADEDDLDDMFNEYFSDSPTIPNSKDESDLMIQFLSHDYLSMTSEVMDLTQFVNEMTANLKYDFQVGEE